MSIEEAADADWDLVVLPGGMPGMPTAWSRHVLLEKSNGVILQ